MRYRCSSRQRCLLWGLMVCGCGRWSAAAAARSTSSLPRDDDEDDDDDGISIHLSTSQHASRPPSSTPTYSNTSTHARTHAYARTRTHTHAPLLLGVAGRQPQVLLHQRVAVHLHGRDAQRLAQAVHQAAGQVGTQRGAEHGPAAPVFRGWEPVMGRCGGTDQWEVTCCVCECARRQAPARVQCACILSQISDTKPRTPPNT